MLIRNQESHLPLVGLDSMEMRTCSFCRRIKQNQRFSRVDCVTADRGEPQAIGCPGYRELVAHPMSNVRWTSTLHISVTAGSLWNCPQDLHMVGDFPFQIDSMSNDFTMHMHGGASSKDNVQALYLEQTTLTLQLLSFGSSRIYIYIYIYIKITSEKSQ